MYTNTYVHYVYIYMHMKSTYKYHLVRQFSIACMYTFLWMTTLYLTTSHRPYPFGRLFPLS